MMNDNLTGRLAVGGLGLVAGLLIGWTVHGLTGYSTDAQTAIAFKNWRVNCPPAKEDKAHCEMVQDIIDSQSRQLVARMGVSTAKDNKPALFLGAPLGVALEPGLGVAFGTDTPTVVPYEVCNVSVCLAQQTIDDKVQKNLDAGKDGKIIIARQDGKSFEIKIMMEGFGEAQSAYRKLEAKRTSPFWRMW